MPVLHSIAALKATAPMAEVYLDAGGRSGGFVWKDGDYSGIVDPLEGLFVASTVLPTSAGIWARQRADDGVYQIDWWGAKEASDILPVFNAAKVWAAGGALFFGRGQYATSGTLNYTATGNRPMVVAGVSETETKVLNSGAGFVIEYFGGAGAGSEARGGGVRDLSLAKVGGGVCSGIAIANVYRGSVERVNTNECGDVGIRITGRAADDQDATFGTRISHNTCRGGNVGILVKGALPGAVVASHVELVGNNCDGNKSCGIWIAGSDLLRAAFNTLTTCGTGSGGVLQRGGLFIEYHGGHCRNIDVEFNEFGNGVTGCDYMLFCEGVVGLTTRRNRFVRNQGEVSVGAYMFGYTSVSTALYNIKCLDDVIVVGTGGFTVATFYGANKTYDGKVVISDLYNANGTPITVSSDPTKTRVFADGLQV